MARSENEEQYIAKMEYEKLKVLREKEKERINNEEIARLKELHWMRCPKCGMELVEIDYKSIRLDKCTSCNGLWFDQGEVESLIKEDKGTMEKIFSIFG